MIHQLNGHWCVPACVWWIMLASGEGEGAEGVLVYFPITRMHFHCQLGSSKVNHSSITN